MFKEAVSYSRCVTLYIIHRLVMSASFHMICNVLFISDIAIHAAKPEVPTASLNKQLLNKHFAPATPHLALVSTQSQTRGGGWVLCSVVKWIEFVNQSDRIPPSSHVETINECRFTTTPLYAIFVWGWTQLYSFNWPSLRSVLLFTVTSTGRANRLNCNVP